MIVVVAVPLERDARVLPQFGRHLKQVAAFQLDKCPTVLHQQLLYATQGRSNIGLVMLENPIAWKDQLKVCKMHRIWC